jgi:MFS family permease
MIVIDGVVVSIASPSIQADLGFSEPSLIWVVNAYVITYSGFLLIGGRLSDLFSPRKLFLFGIALFTVASMVCGLANSQALLIGARAVQGLGGAVVAPVTLSLTMNLFSESSQRATAAGIFNFVASSGASLGLLLGGTLTSLLNWHWLFLINLPLGVATYSLCHVLLPDSPRLTTTNRIDIAGAAAITMSLTLAVYGLVNANKTGWESMQTATFLTSAIAALIIFFYIEARVPSPVVPFRLLRRRNLMVVSVIFLLWGAAISAWYFVSALYLQIILKYSAQQAGFAFLPFTLAGAALSLGVCSKLVMRFGTKYPLIAGLLIASTGMVFFARAPLRSALVTDILPGMLLVGLGTGTVGIPSLLIATKDVSTSESGFVAGIIATAYMMGNALGLAVLVSAGSVYANELLVTGESLSVALNSGYHIVFSVAGGLLAIAPLIAAAFLPRGEGAAEQFRV